MKEGGTLIGFFNDCSLSHEKVQGTEKDRKGYNWKEYRQKVNKCQKEIR